MPCQTPLPPVSLLVFLVPVSHLKRSPWTPCHLKGLSCSTHLAGAATEASSSAASQRWRLGARGRDCEGGRALQGPNPPPLSTLGVQLLLVPFTLLWPGLCKAGPVSSSLEPISTFILYFWSVEKKINQHLIKGTDFGNHVLPFLGVYPLLRVGRALLASREASLQVRPVLFPARQALAFTPLLQWAT